MRILVTPTSLSQDKSSKALKLLSGFADEIIYNPFGRPLEAKEIIENLEGVEGYIAGLDYITDEVIYSAPASLKVISRYGAGYDRVDIEAATKKGILVTNTPGANAQAVADLALGLMLSVARKIPMLDKMTKEGKWIRSTGIELYGKTLGIIGLGAIGKNVAKRAQGFSMKVLAYDPFMNEEYVRNNNIQSTSLENLLTSCDFISLHLPVNQETKHVINNQAFSIMKKNAILINTSRGGLIDEKAAWEALTSGHLGGLGLDAFEKEPPEDSPLFSLDNVVITPHTGAHTVDATEEMGIMAVQNLINVLTGKDCPYIINKNSGR